MWDAHLFCVLGRIVLSIMLHADTHDHHLGLCRCRAVHFCSAAAEGGGGRMFLISEVV